MKKHFSLFLLLCSFTLSAAFAQQTGSIKGFVYDKKNGEPMINAVIRLSDTKMGVVTDINGYFSLTQVPVGSYTLVATQLGYDTFSTGVNITANAVISRKIQLSQVGIQIREVQVSGRRNVRTTQVAAGLTTVTPREMKLLPSAGGEPDIAQYLQVLPGVQFTGDQGGQLYIRGGSPTQTGILLDGVTIYNPFHTIGLFSVFETDAIRNVDVQSAGFNAQYGNRTSAIMDVRTKDGNKNRLAGKLSVSPLMARAMLEGPLVKSKSENGGSTTFLLSAKHSYLDQTSKSLYSGLSDNIQYGLPYAFTDIYGKVTFNSGNGGKVNVFGFSFDDKAKFLKPNTDIVNADFNWKALGGGANFLVSPQGSSTLISGRFAYSKYTIDYNELNNDPRSSGIDGFEGAIEFTNFLPSFSQLRYGIEVSGFHTDLKYRNNYGFVSNLDRRNTLAALYVMYRKNFGEKFILEPGLRMQYYATVNFVSPEPRLGLKYNITNNVRLKAAAGLYSQNVISTKSDRDIVNFFTGFLLSPDQTILDQDGKEVKRNVQTAWHALGGIEVDIKDVELVLEPWTKHFTRNIELNRAKVRAQEADYQAGTGLAYGVDLSAKYAKRRLYLWGAFSYQYVTNTFRVVDELTSTPGGELTKTESLQTYPTPFDRRFNMNLLGAYTLGRKRDLEISLRYNMGSPFPFTQTQGFYEDVNMGAGGIGGNYLTQNGNLNVFYADDINGGRLSWYHRVDLSAKKRFQLTQNSNIETTLSVTNLANRNNIFYVDRLENTRVYQLPLFPSLNVTWNF